MSGSVVACIGYTIPAELVAASGQLAVQVVGKLDCETPVGDEFMEESFSHEIRSVFDQVVAGEWNDANLIVVDRAYRDIYYYLKEVVRLGLASEIPPVHLFDLMMSQSVPVAAYNRVQVDGLVDALQRASGRAVDEPALRDSIAAANRRRSQLRTLEGHRRRGVVPGVDALRAISAGLGLEADEHAAQIQALNEELAGRVPTGVPRLLVLSAERLFHTRLHEVIDAAGATVVAEDDLGGSRAAGDDIVVEADPLQSIAARLVQDPIGPEVRPFSARSAWLTRTLAEFSPDGIVFYVPPSDAEFGWDVPRLTRLAGDIPTLILNEDVLTTDGFVRAGEVVSEFVGTRNDLGVDGATS